MSRNIMDLVGQPIGHWAVLSFAGRDKNCHELWLCRCECGTERIVRGDPLRSGKSQSCGCFPHEALGKTKTTHGYSGDPIYPTWQSMNQRCYNPKDKIYPYYGGRGITVCDRWRNSIEAFRDDILAEIGERPEGCSLDRINNNGNYEPGNVRWATRKQQNRNKRSNVRHEWNGQRLTLSELEDITGIPYGTLWCRVKRGWSVEKALTTPVRKMRRK
jgi:hypothetical protein